MREGPPDLVDAVSSDGDSESESDSESDDSTPTRGRSQASDHGVSPQDAPAARFAVPDANSENETQNSDVSTNSDSEAESIGDVVGPFWRIAVGPLVENLR